MKAHMHQLPELLDAAADLLDHVGDVAGLRAGLYTTLPEGVRLLVKTGHPYTDEVGPLDMIGAALTAEVHHKRWGTLGEAHVSGTWNDMPVYGSHLYSDLPDRDKPCTRSATELSRRARALIPWARQSWTQWAESVHVYDENGTPACMWSSSPRGPLTTHWPRSSTPLDRSSTATSANTPLSLTDRYSWTMERWSQPLSSPRKSEECPQP